MAPDKLDRILHRLNHLDDRVDGMGELLKRFDVRLRRVLECLTPMAEGVVGMDRKLEVLMALVDDLKTSVDKLKVATSKVAARITELTAALRDRSLSETERNDILGQLDELAGHLDEMGTDPANPVPPEPAAMTKKIPGRK